jgi:hypothetical protein
MEYSLEAIFHYGEFFGDPELSSIVELREILETLGWAEMTRVELPPVPRWPPEIMRHFSGGPAHRDLCAQAAVFIEQRGQKWNPYKPDTVYCGGTADVAAIGGNLYVECGYTKSRRVVWALAAGQDVLVVPYLNDIDEPTRAGFLFHTTNQKAIRDRHVARSFRENAEVFRSFDEGKPRR